ncbi:hypothetical protein ACT691_11730 [Vibrio metschnikovii]
MDLVALTLLCFASTVIWRNGRYPIDAELAGIHIDVDQKLSGNSFNKSRRNYGMTHSVLLSTSTYFNRSNDEAYVKLNKPLIKWGAVFIKAVRQGSTVTVTRSPIKQQMPRQLMMPLPFLIMLVDQAVKPEVQSPLASSCGNPYYSSLADYSLSDDAFCSCEENTAQIAVQ